MMEEEIALATILIGVGITAVLYVFRLSEYFETEVERARERQEKLNGLLKGLPHAQTESVSKAMQAQERVFKWYAGRNQRFTLVWTPAFILFLVLLGFLQVLFSTSASSWWFYVISWSFLWLFPIIVCVCIGIQEYREEGLKSYFFSMDIKFKDDLNEGSISNKLKAIFKTKDFPLSENAVVTKKENKWEITDKRKFIIKKFIIQEEDGKLNIYKKYLVLIPISILIVTALGFCRCFPRSPLLTLCVFYFIALLIPSFGAGIGMLGRPIAKYHEVIRKLEGLD